MPKHAVGRGAQAKLRRGSKRAFFTCVGEAGSAGLGLQTSFLPSHCPPPWGLWCFWGFLFSSSHLSKIQPIPCRKNCRHSSVSGLIKLAEALTDLREEYPRTRSVNPARHAHPSRRPWRFFGMGCAWLRAAGGGCLRQGFDFRCARWCCHRQIGSGERCFPISPGKYYEKEVRLSFVFSIYKVIRYT